MIIGGLSKEIKNSLQRNRRYKEVNRNFRMGKYSNQNKNLSGWSGEQKKKAKERIRALEARTTEITQPE